MTNFFGGRLRLVSQPREAVRLRVRQESRLRAARASDAVIATCSRVDRRSGARTQGVGNESIWAVAARDRADRPGGADDRPERGGDAEERRRPAPATHGTLHLVAGRAAVTDKTGQTISNFTSGTVKTRPTDVGTVTRLQGRRHRRRAPAATFSFSVYGQRRRDLHVDPRQGRSPVRVRSCGTPAGRTRTSSRDLAVQLTFNSYVKVTF